MVELSALRAFLRPSPRATAIAGKKTRYLRIPSSEQQFFGEFRSEIFRRRGMACVGPAAENNDTWDRGKRQQRRCAQIVSMRRIYENICPNTL
jgi:hypothetical protein